MQGVREGIWDLLGFAVLEISTFLVFSADPGQKVVRPFCLDLEVQIHLAAGAEV